MSRWKVTFEMDVHGDRWPGEWDWPNIIDVTDDVDTLDESSITVTKVGE